MGTPICRRGCPLLTADSDDEAFPKPGPVSTSAAGAAAAAAADSVAGLPGSSASSTVAFSVVPIPGAPTTPSPGPATSGARALRSGAAAAGAGSAAAVVGAAPTAADSSAALSAGSESATEEIAALDSRLVILKRDETDLTLQLERMRREKEILVRRMRLLQCEEHSRFYNDAQILNERYQLLRMLGRGGFSEVFLVRDRSAAIAIAKARALTTANLAGPTPGWHVARLLPPERCPGVRFAPKHGGRGQGAPRQRGLEQGAPRELREARHARAQDSSRCVRTFDHS